MVVLRSLPPVSAVLESQQVFREASWGRIHRDKVKLFFPFWFMEHLNQEGSSLRMLG